MYLLCELLFASAYHIHARYSKADKSQRRWFGYCNNVAVATTPTTGAGIAANIGTIVAVTGTIAAGTGITDTKAGATGTADTGITDTRTADTGVADTRAEAPAALTGDNAGTTPAGTGAG